MVSKANDTADSSTIKIDDTLRNDLSTFYSYLETSCPESICLEEIRTLTSKPLLTSAEAALIVTAIQAQLPNSDSLYVFGTTAPETKSNSLTAACSRLVARLL